MSDAPLRFDEQQDPEHDPKLDSVREFKARSERGQIWAVVIIIAAILALLPVLRWVLQQPV